MDTHPRETKWTQSSNIQSRDYTPCLETVHELCKKEWIPSEEMQESRNIFKGKNDTS